MLCEYYVCMCVQKKQTDLVKENAMLPKLNFFIIKNFKKAMKLKVLFFLVQSLFANRYNAVLLTIKRS